MRGNRKEKQFAVGQTIGEDLLFSQIQHDCFCSETGCVLAIKVKQLQKLKKKLIDLDLRADFFKLGTCMRNCYKLKRELN